MVHPTPAGLVNYNSSRGGGPTHYHAGCYWTTQDNGMIRMTRQLATCLVTQTTCTFPDYHFACILEIKKVANRFDRC